MKNLSSAILILCAILIITGCEKDEKNTEDKETTDELQISSVSFTDCNTVTKSSESNAPSLRLKSCDNGYLWIEAKNTEFCCGADSIRILDSINNNAINIQIICEGPHTYCWCNRNIEFMIGPFKNENYSLTFIESEHAYSRDTFKISFNYSQDLDTLITKPSRDEQTTGKIETSLLSFTDCNVNTKSSASNDHELHLKSSDNNYLWIKAINTEFCCGAKSIAILDSIDNDDINIQIICNEHKRCWCNHDVEFLIGPLSNKKYTLTFIESEHAYERDTFAFDFTYSNDLDTIITKSSQVKMLSTNPLDYQKTVLGGCNGIMIKSASTTSEEKPDTIIFTEIQDTLKIFAGLNLPCCIEFENKSMFEGDTLIMKIKNIRDEQCDCICYYTFDFIYTKYQQQGFYYVFYYIFNDYTMKYFTGKYNIP